MEDKLFTRELLIEEIRGRSRKGGAIRFPEVRDDTSFEDAVYEEFGSWSNAFIAAGVNPKTKLLNYWTEDEVIKRLQQIAHRDEPINTLSLEINHPRLWNAARRLFGNIEKAINKAGFQYENVRKRYSWNEDEITNRIRIMFDEGEDISQISMMKKDSRLLASGQKLFGAWSRAVEKSGIDYSTVKVRRKTMKKNSGTAIPQSKETEPTNF
ncbi:MAG TPA: hypothetical protein PLQ76_02890 [bacterium]|nr:hypothetical protein [bacterium]